MKIIFKGVNNEKGNLPKITGEAEKLLIIQKDGQFYEIDRDTTDYAFINMNEVISVQLKLKEEDKDCRKTNTKTNHYTIGDFINDLSKQWDTLDDIEKRDTSHKIMKSKNKKERCLMTIKEQILNNHIREEAFDMRNRLCNNITAELVSRIEYNCHDEEKFQKLFALRSKILNTSLDDFLETEFDEDLQKYNY